MKIRHPYLLRLLGFLVACVLRIWASTIHLKIIQLDSTHHPADYKRNRFLYAIWHDSILALPHFHSRAHILISKHADGEFISHAARLLNADVIRGSTTRGGTSALLRLIRLKKPSHLIVTPDGPVGPRHEVQRGMIFLASMTGLPIIPVSVSYRAYWQAKSWDRLVLPKPFTSAISIMGQAIHIPKKLRGEKLEEYRQLVQQRLLELDEMADRLINGQELTKKLTLEQKLAG